MVLLQPPRPLALKTRRQEGRTGEEAATWGLGGGGGGLPGGLSVGVLPIWLRVASSSRRVSSRLSIRWGVVPLTVQMRPAAGWPLCSPLQGWESCPESLGVSSGCISAVEGA